MTVPPDGDATPPPVGSFTTEDRERLVRMEEGQKTMWRRIDLMAQKVDSLWTWRTAMFAGFAVIIWLLANPLILTTLRGEAP